MITSLILCSILLLKMVTSKKEIEVIPTSNSLMAIDFSSVLIISVAICLASHQLLFMSVFVPIIILLRFVFIHFWVTKTELLLKTEIPFFIIITLLGAFNDWNSVTNKKIYDYTVPHLFEFTTIPVWMLLYWGVILRTVYSFSKWHYLKPQRKLNNVIGLKTFQINNSTVKILFELSLVFVTRQFIYRYYLDPVLSWLPFALALLICLLLFNLNAHDLKLIFTFLIVGPLIEILYMEIGNLHYYHLGIFYGVPVWIIMWWLIIILIWKDLAPRIEFYIKDYFNSSKFA